MEIPKNIQNYYAGIDEHRNLYYDDNSIGGIFNYEKIEIGICGVDERFYSKKLLELLEELTISKDKTYLSTTSLSDLMSTNKDVKDAVKFVQILFHESLHVLQTFTLQACNEHMYWIRNFRDLEFAIFSLNIMYGYSWNYGERIINEVCWEWINKREPWIKKRFDNYSDLQQGICDNFTNLSTRKLSTIDIIEGEAFAFQEFVTDSIGKDVFSPDENSIYKKSFNYFKASSQIMDVDTLYVTFIITCHLSLKFGSSRYINDENTASAIFDHLLKFANTYANRYNSYFVEDTDIKERKQWLYDNDYMNLLSEHQVLQFAKVSMLIDAVTDGVLDYFRNTLYGQSYMENREQAFYDKTVQHFDRKMEPIKEFLERKYPSFSSKYFLSILLVGSNNISQNFVQCVRDVDLLDTFIESPNGKKITVENDNFIFQIMHDFQQLLLVGNTYCCNEHGIINKKRVIMKCSNDDSLRNRLKNLYGEHIEISNLVNQQ